VLELTEVEVVSVVDVDVTVVDVDSELELLREVVWEVELDKLVV
jgi:hypothetical protein